MRPDYRAVAPVPAPPLAGPGLWPGIPEWPRWRDCSVVLGSSLTEVRTDLAEVGVALLTGVSGPAALLELAEALGAVVPHRDSGPDGVTVIEDRGSAGGAWAGFSRMGLSPHTDRSGIASPPGLVLTVCGREPLTGGEALLVDGRAVYAHLAARDPDALAAFSIPRTALFGGGGGHLGAVFTTHASLTVIRLRLDALVRFAPALLDHLPALRRAIDAHTVAVALAAGHGYAINNRRWLHGRRAFTGPRALYRVTAEACTGMVPAGFHPPTDDETYHLTAHRQKTND